jgi:hypothetical protein
MEKAPRMIAVTDIEERHKLMFDAADIACPRFVILRDNSIWADADELRAWRELQSTSDGQPR